MLDMLESALMNTDYDHPATKKKKVTESVATIDGSGVVQHVSTREVPEMYTTQPVPGPMLYSPIKRESQHIPLSALYQMQREMKQPRFTIPKYQREYVWEYEIAAKFLMAILLGVPVDPVKINRHYDEAGNLIEDALDGQQRMETIIRFKEGRIRLPSREQYEKFSPDSRLPLLGEKCRYKTLPAPLLKRFDSYGLEFVFMEDVPDDWVPQIFTDFQNHRRLNVGQILWAKENATANLAKALADYNGYPFWSIVFKQPGKNQEVSSDRFHVRYMSALCAIALEMTEKPYTLQVRKEGLNQWASGLHDKDLPGDILDRVERRFDGIAQVFAAANADTPGANAGSRLDMLVMYQLACHLERSKGYDLRFAPRGCFVPWFEGIKLARRRQGGRSFSPISFLGDRVEQEKFWDIQLPLILDTKGLVKASQVDEAYLAEMATSGAW